MVGAHGEKTPYQKNFGENTPPFKISRGKPHPPVEHPSLYIGKRPSRLPSFLFSVKNFTEKTPYQKNFGETTPPFKISRGKPHPPVEHPSLYIGKRPSRLPSFLFSVKNFTEKTPYQKNFGETTPPFKISRGKPHPPVEHPSLYIGKRPSRLPSFLFSVKNFTEKTPYQKNFGETTPPFKISRGKPHPPVEHPSLYIGKRPSRLPSFLFSVKNFTEKTPYQKNFGETTPPFKISRGKPHPPVEHPSLYIGKRPSRLPSFLFSVKNFTEKTPYQKNFGEAGPPFIITRGNHTPP